MIGSLPAETVFEAKRRTRRATVVLLLLLMAMYVVFFNIFALAAGFLMYFLVASRSVELMRRAEHVFGSLWLIVLAATAVSVLAAVVHFLIARGKPLEKILGLVGGRPPDRRDEYHKRFVNIVHEAEAATGIHGIRPVVIPTTGLNAFSMQDGKRNSAIGVTEGLIARLDRSELTAAVAHEAAHLVNDDSKLTTTACSLVGVFDRICGALDRSIQANLRGAGPRSERGAPVIQAILWVVAALGAFVTRLIYMAMSRKRELLADAHAVQMCKDPLSLAEALYKISGGYRGAGDVPAGLSPLFVVSPRPSALDESEGVVANLFCTHPPLARRLSRLTAWANSDVGALRTSLAEKDRRRAPEEKRKEESKFFVHHEGLWRGPYMPMQMLAMGVLGPTTWICAHVTVTGFASAHHGAEAMRAADSPVLLPLFEKRVQRSVSPWRCPRCKVPLIKERYEGAPVLHCGFCGGHLLRLGVLERVIARREKGFDASEIEKAKVWRKSRKGRARDLCGFPEISCPLCGGGTRKYFHSFLTKVVIDRCAGPACGAIWCDGGELERIQMLVEAAGS